jgi:hypothetical protein
VGQVPDDEVAMRGMAGRDREAAVADHQGGHAEGGRGRGVRIPGELRVVVGVQVHDAGGQDQTLRVDARAGGAKIGAAAVVADGRDAPVRDREAIDETGVVDDEIVHGASGVRAGVTA